MTGYLQVNLNTMINEIGENEVKAYLSDFSCPLNRDVEYFLHNKAVEFSRQGISATHLVMASYKGKYVLVGYYALANKTFIVQKEAVPSKSWQRRLNKFGQYDSALKRYFIPTPLIGQLGKNYTNSYDRLITGNELLKLAMDKVQQMQMIAGGKTVYLECENKDRLIEFYENNGFVNFGKRILEGDETEKMEGKYLIQMLKYI